ncbi:MAG: 1,4-alpha-glucan branching enzyme, partial [Micrococcales bacterium]|nr:1,4-alpha-glucan branching enzyme [Micrococcales bacterium]
MTTLRPVPVNDDLLRAVGNGTHYDPHCVLGAHPTDDSVTVRVLRPGAQAVTVVTADTRTEATHEIEGVWVAVLAGPDVPDYRLEVTYDGTTTTSDDPYRFWPTLGEVDLHLINEGRHERLWRVLGANVKRFDGGLGAVTGTAFAVWAPTAKAVRLVGDFNFWQGRTHAMRSLGSSGVWELFVPDLLPGTTYKYEIIAADGSWRQKADPMARATEVPPATASVVVEEDYTWTD